MQLTVTNRNLTESLSSASGIKSRSASMSLIGDPPGVGRLSFLILSHLHSDSKPSQSASPQPFSWVSQLQFIIQWLESRRPSPPFHKSRLLLLLRDVLYGRQLASILIFLQPSSERMAVNAQWLALLSRIIALGRNSQSENNTSNILQRSSSSDDSSNTQVDLSIYMIAPYTYYAAFLITASNIIK
jgi:hypothetical protein